MKKVPFQRRTNDTMMAKLIAHFGIDDVDELKRQVHYNYFLFDDRTPLIVWAVEKFDLYDPRSYVERHRWPRDPDARLALLRDTFSRRNFDSPAHAEVILKFQREQWNSNVRGTTWPDELTQLIRSRPVLHE